jgi:tetratricopeptide (TPR) repeat protein
MKKIVCELCECMEFTKEGGMFVCQGCGTKYTAEEARGMMKEVEGGAPSPAAGAPAINPSQQQLDNILVLATNAYEADNKKEAENYCNRAIEIDAMCYKAWFLKGRAVGWQSKIDDLRIEEAAHSFCKAIDYAPEELKEELKDEAVQELKSLGIALISLRKQRFSGSPDSEELKGFTSARKVLIDSLTVLLSHGNIVGIPDGYLEEIATLMNEAAVAALNMARKAWNNVEHPSVKDLSTYIDWIGNPEE